MVESFEQARALSRVELERLLASDRPEQRLWAIWSLALMLGDGAGDFAHRILDEPDPGVRRHLAVMLAGHGELDLLLELVDNDRSPVVRESSVALVARIAAGTPPAHPRAARMRELLEDAERSTPELRTALVGAIGKGAPEYQIAIARRALAADSSDLQGEAFEALLRIDTPSTVHVARAWFRGRTDLPSYVERWLRASTMLSLAEVTRDLPVDLRREVLAKLRSPPWPAVELLIGEDLQLWRVLLARSDIAIPATLLARAVLRGSETGFAERLTVKLDTAATGRELLASIRGALLDEPELATRELADRVKAFGDALEIADRDELLDEVANTHPVEQLMALEHAVVRWMSERDAPTELLPMLAELEHHCAQRLMVMQAAGQDRKPPNRRARLGEAGMNPELRYQHYREMQDLQAAIRRLADRS